MAKSDTPPPVAFNLNEIEAEKSESAPFVSSIDGKPVVFKDAMSLDWQDLMLAAQDPRRFIRLVLEPEDADAFLRRKTSIKALRALMAAYNAHYGMPSELGELNASST